MERSTPSSGSTRTASSSSTAASNDVQALISLLDQFAIGYRKREIKENTVPLTYLDPQTREKKKHDVAVDCEISLDEGIGGTGCLFYFNQGAFIAYSGIGD